MAEALTFTGNTTDVINQLNSAAVEYGNTLRSQRGLIKSLRGVKLTVEDPLNETANYPYWPKRDDGWYQDNFVRKEVNIPPERRMPGHDIYPFRYSDRSRYFDSGVGYVKGTIDLLREVGVYSVDQIKGPSSLTELLKETYTEYHPERVLAALLWQGRELANFYLKLPELLEQQLRGNRRDTLESVVEELKQSPNSRRAITPSFTYEQVDHSAVAGGVPPYQQYQVLVDFDSNGNPTGFSSYHLHRSIDAAGGVQLDISHDREWGKIVSDELGLPLNKIVVYANDAHLYLSDEQGNEALTGKTTIRDWLFGVVDGYDPKKEDVEKRLASPIYQKKITAVLERLKAS